MCKHTAAKGVEGHSPLGKFRCPEIAEGGGGGGGGGGSY